MTPIVIALACVLIAYLSTKLLKYFASAVPAVLIGLPVIFAGLGCVAAVMLAQATGLDPGAAATAGLVGTIASFIGGGLLSKRYFESAMKN